MKKFILLVFSALIAASCASPDTRTPASQEEKQDVTHQKFEGYFDKPDH